MQFDSPSALETKRMQKALFADLCHAIANAKPTLVARYLSEGVDVNRCVVASELFRDNNQFIYWLRCFGVYQKRVSLIELCIYSLRCMAQYVNSRQRDVGRNTRKAMETIVEMLIDAGFDVDRRRPCAKCQSTSVSAGPCGGAATEAPTAGPVLALSDALSIVPQHKRQCTDGTGLTALHEAMRNNCVSLAKVLLAHGADVRATCLITPSFRDGGAEALLEATPFYFACEALQGCDPEPASNRVNSTSLSAMFLTYALPHECLTLVKEVAAGGSFVFPKLTRNCEGSNGSAGNRGEVTRRCANDRCRLWHILPPPPAIDINRPIHDGEKKFEQHKHVHFKDRRKRRAASPSDG